MAGNLPLELDRFVGRHRELGEVRRLLEQARLVTLTGPGGIGKTRLALRLAANAAQTGAAAYPDGVWLLSLSELTTPDEITELLLDTLGVAVELEPGNCLDSLLTALRGRRLLLVVDNCEHLAVAVAGLLRRVLQAAAGVRVLATSRIPLQVPGEHLQPVGSLDLGTRDGRSEAAQLLLERARAVTAEPGDDADVELLCRLLEGVPLAITLAAARLRVVGIKDLVDDLDGGTQFGVLDTGQHAESHGGQPWHRTLAATNDWSYALCTPAEQRLWDRLAVFPGGFDPRSAEVVCADDQLDAVHLPHLLVRLVDQSILLADIEAGTSRYYMLDSVRSSGVLRLRERGQEEQQLRQAHAEHYLDLARQATDAVGSDHEIGWVRRIELEMPNLHAAVNFLLADGQADQALELAVELARTRWALAAGQPDQARDLLWRTLDAQIRPHALQAAGHVLAAQLDLSQGDPAHAERHLAAAEAIARQLGSPPELQPWLLAGHGGQLLAAGEARSLAVLRQARDTWDQHAEPNTAYPGRGLLALAAALLGDAATARGETEDASWCRGVTELRHGSPQAAATLLAGTAHRHLTLGDLWGSAWSLEALAWAAAACRHDEQAAVLLGAAHHHRLTTVTMAGLGPIAELHNQWSATTQARLGEQEFGAAFEHGTTLDHTGVLAYLRALPEPAQHSGQPPGGLSAREYEVAGLVTAGLTNRQIAEQLVLSIRTIDTHVDAIRHKLGVSGTGSRLRIARWWGEQNQR